MASARPTLDVTVERLREAYPELSRSRCAKAITFAEEIYGDRSFELIEGMTLFEHAVATAEILVRFCPDEDAVIACILQHALKVPDHSLDRLAEEFGVTVRDMVSRVHLLAHLHTSDRRKSVADMKIMLVSISDDIRILLITFAIECYFMEHLQSVRSADRSRICRQALQLFAPVAARLGIYALKYRLERTAFPQCYATDANAITEQLSHLHAEHGEFLPQTVASLKRFLSGEGVKADVLAREKQPYSIFQKMRTKSVSSLGKINDLFAIRVIVPTVADCYQALGHLHRIATPISHRFKDYISFPKPNGYQSLHTCLMGLPDAPKKIMIEVQIRTEDMHHEAEYGIAAHWLYKDAKNADTVLRSASRFQLTDVLLKQQQSGGAFDHESHDASIRLVDHIYVLTPRGDILELPDDSSPLDFAFMLHTDLGLKFKAARVNGSIVPISHRLENGDVVEILTHKHPRPSLQWLEELATPSARSKLKAYFFSHNRPEFLLRGREMANNELRTRGLPPLDNDLSALHTFDGKDQTIREREDLLVKVGMGSIRTSSILRHMPLKQIPRKVNRGQKKVKTAVSARKITDLVSVEGSPLSMPYRFAKCCAPSTATPRPEKIVGIITKNSIISVHRDGCHMAKAANPQRRVKMKWN